MMIDINEAMTKREEDQEARQFVRSQVKHLRADFDGIMQQIQTLDDPFEGAQVVSMLAQTVKFCQNYLTK